MTAALLFIRAHWRAILIALSSAALLAWVASAVHDYGQRQYQAGRNAVIAADAIAAAQDRLDADRRAATAAAAGVAMHAALDIALPKLEVTTHAAVDRVQTIYLAQPAAPAAVCVRPQRVQDELDAALRTANAAAAGHL